MDPINFVILAAVLFAIGAAAVVLRRNAIVAFMGGERERERESERERERERERINQ